MDTSQNLKLDQLTDTQRTMMFLIAKDYRYKEVAHELKLDTRAMSDAVIELFNLYGVSSTAWEEGYEELARIGRELQRHSMTSPDRADTSGDEGGEEEDGGNDMSTSAGRAASEYNFDEVVRRIRALKPTDAELLRDMLATKKGDGTRDALIARLGITPATLSYRIHRLMRVKLGLADFRGRKTLLRDALRAADTTHVQEASSHVAVDSEDRAPVMVPSTSVDLAEAARASSSPAGSANGHVTPGVHSAQGHAAVIAIPTTVEDADVVSGLFHGTHPAPGLEAQIKKRKGGGFQPSFLVLTATNDPQVTHAQMVFFKHEREK